MATAIYDPSGTVVGWLDGKIVRELSGQHRAFVQNDNVFTYQGMHLGTFKNGFFRDRSGHAVTFIPGAQGGALPPLPALAPLPPLFPLAPLTPLPPLPPVPPIPSLSWSNQGWEDYIQG